MSKEEYLKDDYTNIDKDRPQRIGYHLLKPAGRVYNFRFV